jgi:hypothetical protein
LGFRPGAPFDLTGAPAPVRDALEAAPATAFAQIKSHLARADALVNNWQMVSSPICTYGTDYLKRALIAFMGLGANPSRRRRLSDRDGRWTRATVR